ncbi:MAG TPA: hypothetical protein VH144_01805 [Candidatus Saccharimonadales bacterium]|jgi:hypothetical protein|nr:hypothetical protein [Candidatus Saccharimonadales bacterium]
MKKKLFGFVLAVAVLAVMGRIHPALAASSSLQLSLEPAIFDLGGAPGTSMTTHVRVKNITAQPELVQVGTQAFKPLGKVDDSALRSTFNAASWLQTDQPVFTLDPNQTKSIAITASIPANAEPGGHYATVSFTLLSKASIDSGPRASVDTRISGLALLTVKGPLTYKITVGAPYLNQDSDMPQLNVPLKNEGTIHALTTQRVTVKDIFGNIVAEWAGTPALILPTESRVISMPWKISLPGWYRVQTSVTYSSRHTTVQSPTVTIAIAPPVWSIVLLVFGMVIGIVGWLGRGRWRKAWRTLWKTW